MLLIHLYLIVDNDVDNNIGDTVAEQRKFGVAYAKAILEFFGIEEKPSCMYYVQVGAYSIKANAEDMLARVKAAGFNGFIKIQE